ncbi:MAG: cytochrome c maturation protein CcmE [Coriobacteriales bacterium]|jgi:cytochrome c-type biogenesis protein CcmE|nr:cytochrome c maturation protein CcmE [Coriobacteriales bacterium]
MKLRRRLAVVTGIIVIVILGLLAVVQGAAGSKVVSVAEAASGQYAGQRVQVTGLVLDNSLVIGQSGLHFTIYDESDTQTTLQVSFDGALSATFGNQVIAICTGTMSDDGVLLCSKLVTKCPSKYENATDALTISELFDYGDNLINVPVKVTGTVKAGSINPATSAVRFVIFDPVSKTELSVVYQGGLPDQIEDNTALVLTGSLDDKGFFNATDIAIQE